MPFGLDLDPNMMVIDAILPGTDPVVVPETPLYADWTLVRRVQRGGVWHEATDDLQGTAQYGEPDCTATKDCSFAVKFAQEDFEEFKFTTGDEALWMKMLKENVYSSASNTPLQIESSHNSPTQS
jgi:hypothetical protein